MIKIICVGKIKENYLNDWILDYQKRVNKFHKLVIEEVKDDESILKEEESIMRKISPKDFVITLEILGHQCDSIEFAKKLDELFITNSSIAFVIGGSNGLSERVKMRSNMKLSFSKMTFPHGMFRAVLLEQIYRAFKINNNETYHK